MAKIALSAEFQGFSWKFRALKNIFRTLENGHSIRHQSIPPLSAGRNLSKTPLLQQSSGGVTFWGAALPSARLSEEICLSEWVLSRALRGSPRGFCGAPRGSEGVHGIEGSETVLVT